MSYAMFEITWTIHLLKDLGITNLRLATIHCGNQSALNITHNLSYMIEPNTLKLIVILLWKKLCMIF